VSKLFEADGAPDWTLIDIAVRTSLQIPLSVGRGAQRTYSRCLIQIPVALKHILCSKMYFWHFMRYVQISVDRKQSAERERERRDIRDQSGSR